MNVELLEDHMKACGVSNSELAEKLEIDVSTWIRKKKNNGEKITIGEVLIICKTLRLTGLEALEIFLPEYSQKCECM